MSFNFRFSPFFPAPSHVHSSAARNLDDRACVHACLFLSNRLYVKIFYQTIKSIHSLDNECACVCYAGSRLNTEIICILNFFVFLMMMTGAC